MTTAVDGVEFTPGELDRDATFYVAGHRGLVGSAIVRRLKAAGFENVVGKTSAELDLKDRDAVFAYLGETKPKYVVLAAAKVGGILANSTYPVDFLSDNMRIQVNVLDAALANDVERVLFLGSSCIYPKFAEQPIREDSLLTATRAHERRLRDREDRRHPADPGRTPAVRTAVDLGDADEPLRPNDNFSPKGSHVLPALIRRYDEAAKSGAPTVTNWGTGTAARVPPRRRHGRCLPPLLEHYDGPDQVNVGTGSDVTIVRSPRRSPRSSATRARPSGTRRSPTARRRSSST